MQKDKAESFFKHALRIWETGSTDDLLKMYHPEYIEHRHGKIIDLNLLIRRFTFAQKNYVNINYQLVDLIILKDNNYLSMSKFYATDAATQKPAEMVISTLFHLANQKIIESWAVSTNEIDIASDMAGREDLTVESAQRKKLDDILAFNFKEKVSLSERETDCLYLYLIALPLRDIATKLHISPTTVETHLRNIKHKCSVKKKADLKKIFKLI